MMPPEVRQLFERFNQLGEMLPRDHDFLADPAAVAEAMLVIDEMQKVDAQTQVLLDRYRQPTKHNVVCLADDKRYANSAAAARMRRTRARRKAGKLVLSIVVDERLPEYLAGLGYLPPYCENRDALARGIERYFEILCLEKELP